MNNINKYSKQELIQIIKCYDQYLQDWFDEDEDLRAGQEPVCIYEFIDNEYQEMLDAGYDNYNDFVNNSKKVSIYDTGVNASYGDQLLTLSTCEYSQKNGRMVVVAKKV